MDIVFVEWLSITIGSVATDSALSKVIMCASSIGSTVKMNKHYLNAHSHF